MYTSINQIRRAFWLSRSWEGFQGWDCRSYPESVQNAFKSFLESICPAPGVYKFITL